MDSDHKSFTISAFFTLTALVLIVLLLGQCGVRSYEWDFKKEQATLAAKRECALNRGEWSVIKKDRDWDVEYCKMPR